VSLSTSGLVRTCLVALAGIGIVVAATHSEGALALGSGAVADQASGAATTPVRSSSLVCPGPELKGLQGVDDADLPVRLAAAAAPLRTLTGTQPAPAAGKLGLTRMPSGALAAPLTARGATLSTDLAKAAGVLVSGTESMAPGIAAAQGWLVPSGDLRSLGGAPCTQPGAEFWILAGGGDPGRQERLVLTNPGGNPVSVDATLTGADGAVSSPNGKDIVVPAHGRTSFLLDSISGDLANPVVHVVAEGGVVAAVVNDTWLDGTRAAGSDDAVPAAAPSRDQVIPAVSVTGRSVLRVAVPGTSEAVVQARVLTAQGARALPGGGVIRIDGGAVRDIDLSRLPAATVGIQVRADVPVVAGAMVTRALPGQPGDLAWTSSTPPITGVAGLPLVDPPTTATGSAGAATSAIRRSLSLTSSGDTAGVEVVTVDAQGVETSRRPELGVDASSSIDITGAASVWVHRVSGRGQVRAGVVSWVTDPQGVLISTVPLRDAVLRTTSIALREATQ
jgi:hypothetical protein